MTLPTTSPGTLQSAAPAGAARGDGLLIDLAEAARTLGDGLFSRLVELARSPRLLVATDYDGTIAPLVDRPTRAFPLDLNVATMRALSSMPSTQSAVISGRSLRDLAAMSRLPREVHLVGSHGGEFGIDEFDDLAPQTQQRLTALRAALLDLHGDHPDVFIEFKPLGAAVHLRGRSPEQREAVTAWVRETCARIGIEPVRGRDVFDLTVIPGSKGDALEALRTRLGADAVLYIGDDVADETALATLRDGDLGLRVGTDGDTRAHSRISDPQTVGIALAALYELRRSWLFGRSSIPVERHSLLGNGHSTALVDPNGRICWMPHPLPHSASVFSEILGSSAAGYFSVGPAASAAGGRSRADSRADIARTRPLTQRYRDDTMTVVTRWAGLAVADYLAPVPDDSQDTVLVRVLTGTAPTEIRFAPRLDYGAAPTSLEVEPGVVRVDNTSEPMALHAAGIDFEIVEEHGSQTAVARVVPADLPGGELVLAFTCGRASDFLDSVLAGDEHRVRALAEGFWENWARSLALPEHMREGVVRSALTLRALCHAPTGGVLAAPTTSLPEGIGGVRNWDYRYTWLRDGSMTVRALLDLGSTAEAEGFVQWLRGILAEAPGAGVPPSPVRGGRVRTHVRGGARAPAGLRRLPPRARGQRRRAPGAAGRLRPRRRAAAGHRHRSWRDRRCGVGAARRDGHRRRGPLARGGPRHLGGAPPAQAQRVHEGDVLGDPRSRDRRGGQVRADPARRVAGPARADRGGGHRPRLERDRPVLHRGLRRRRPRRRQPVRRLSGMLAADDPRFLATVDAVERELREGPTV